jgi:hypothetical protein
VTARVTPFNAVSRTRFSIEVSIDPRDLTFQRASGRWTGLFDMLAAQYSNQGRSLSGNTQTVSEDLIDETYQELMRKGLTITLYEDLARGAEELRIVVRDAPTGAVGSVRVPLRALSAQSRSDRP